MMTSNKPYLVKAFFDWIIDNELTPYMVIDANVDGTQLPEQFVKDGQIVLNVSPSACVNFFMDLEWVSFQARFGGQAMIVRYPIAAVTAIYAKENGAGTVFTPEKTDNDPQPEPPTPPSKPPTKKASLRVVK
jgi:stringent starvation protein B